MSKHTILNWIVTISFSLKQDNITVTQSHDLTIKLKGSDTKLLDTVPKKLKEYVERLLAKNEKFKFDKVSTIKLSATDQQYFPAGIPNHDNYIQSIHESIQKELYAIKEEMDVLLTYVDPKIYNINKTHE